MKKTLQAILLAMLGVTSIADTAGAQDYPTRPITIVIGIAAGGITDVTTRIFAEAVSKRLGQNIVVENRAGGGGAVAATTVSNATPDGYTLLAFLGSQQAVTPAMQKVSFDPVKSFKHITLLFDLVTFIAVPAESPAKTMAELLQMGKTNGKGLSFGSPGVATPSHLLAALIARETKTPVEYVHYRGGSPMMIDLAANRVDFALPSYTVAAPYLADKRLRVLAVDAPSRLALLPDAPTMTEVGLGKEKVASWVGISAPGGTPAAIVDKLNAEFRAAANDPELKARLARNGTPIVTTTPAEMTRLLEEEVQRTAPLIQQLGISANK